MTASNLNINRKQSTDPIKKELGAEPAEGIAVELGAGQAAAVGVEELGREL
jgi:hypothetical protein